MFFKCITMYKKVGSQPVSPQISCVPLGQFTELCFCAGWVEDSLPNVFPGWISRCCPSWITGKAILKLSFSPQKPPSSHQRATAPFCSTGTAWSKGRYHRVLHRLNQLTGFKMNQQVKRSSPCTGTEVQPWNRKGMVTDSWLFTAWRMKRCSDC